MASIQLEIEQDTLDAIEVKQRSTDEDQYKKVLDRPYVAPSLVDHAAPSPGAAGREDEEAQTSHYDYNFDEKDYKSRRKVSTKYHAPLRRISTSRRKDSFHDKSPKHHKKKHKKEHQREARLQELVNHEDEKAKSREKSGPRRHGVVAKTPEVEHNDQAQESEGFDLGSQTINETSLDTPVMDESERVPSLAAREDDTIEVEPIPSPAGSQHGEGENELQSFEFKDVKIDIPVDIPLDDQIEMVPSLSSREDDGIREEEPLIYFTERENEKQLLKHQVNGIHEAKIDIPDGNTIPSLASRDDTTLQKLGSSELDENQITKQKYNEEEDDDDVDLQMDQIRRDGELTTNKQLRKFASKDRRDSFTVDILPKIHEHESFDEPVSIVISDYEAGNGEEALAEELDFDSRLRDRDRLDPEDLTMGRKRHHHHRKHHRKHEIKQHRTISEREALAERSRIRSGLLTLQETETQPKNLSIEGEEPGVLEKKDLEEIAWHRFEDLRGLRRRRPHLRKARLRSGTLTRQSSTDTITASIQRFPVKYDHSPHEAFIELQELTHKQGCSVWRETARWIKFEEDVEASNRWGRPHVASLTFQSLLELRRGLEKGTILLDLEQFDIHSIVETIAENMVITDQLPRSDKDVIMDALLLKHRHQYQQETSITRRPSLYNLMSFSSQNACKEDENKFPEQPETIANDDVIRLKIDDDAASDYSDPDDPQKSQAPLYIPDVEENETPKKEVIFAPPAKTDEKPTRKIESNVKSRIPPNAEATAVMVGAIKELKSPVLAFVRIAKGCYLEGLTEVNIPCRFIFVMLGPSDNNDTYYEIGRSISTLMSDQVFHDLAYYSESREDLLQAINEFLDDTIVLPPGEWDRQLLIPLLMGQSKVMAKRRKEAKEINAIAVAAAEEQDGPLQRTGRLCGGLVRDVKRRAECYISDFTDGFNLHCLWVTLFLYFAVFAPNIAFGGLLSDKTEHWLGISEVIFATCMSGILFGLLAGQPLIIIGATGPVLVFEQSIFQFCKQFDIEFLPWRFWIGMWVMIILFIVVVFEGCFLVRYFTRFTEEVFGSLISAIFIYEAINYLFKVFKANPLVRNFSNGTVVMVETGMMIAAKEPNTALMTVILLFGTFFVAFYMQKVRHSHFFGKQVRRLISDFGIIIAMATMTILDLAVGDRVVTDKVWFGNPFDKGGFHPTRYKDRGWVINPIGLKDTMQPGWVFAAVIPALFIGILLFMETELTGVLLNKKENNLQKLPGFNIDLIVMGFITFVCGIFGLPWMCAATVRSISHFTALSVWSRSHAPGERPFLVDVKEQRVTNISIHILTGVSIVLAPVLLHIPISVLFGVLLYLGVASLGHIQLVNRIVMLFMPPKHHPDVRYVRKVRTSKIYWFTAVQIVSLVILIIVKLTDIAPAFPFFIICLIPVRRFLSKFFTEEELEELDNEEGEDESDDDDLDLLMHR